MTTRLDLTGLKCPLPVLKARRALSRLEAGQLIEICCTDPMAVIDIPHMVERDGDRIMRSDHESSQLVFLIEKGAR